MKGKDIGGPVLSGSVFCLPLAIGFEDEALDCFGASKELRNWDTSLCVLNIESSVVSERSM